jgi:cytochrome c2
MSHPHSAPPPPASPEGHDSEGHGEGHGHGLSPFTRLFVYAVIVADVFAIVYFGGTYVLTGSIIPHKTEDKVVVAGAEEEAPKASAEAAPAEPAFDLASYVADPVKGEKVAAKCKACHTFAQGEPNRVGPNQWGIMGGPLGHSPGFAYSSALLAKKAEVPVWTDEAMHAFLAAPKEWLPGTKMQFNGIRNPQERADLIAWMKTLK